MMIRRFENGKGGPLLLRAAFHFNHQAGPRRGRSPRSRTDLWSGLGIITFSLLRFSGRCNATSISELAGPESSRSRSNTDRCDHRHRRLARPSIRPHHRVGLLGAKAPVDEYVLNASRPKRLTAARNPFRSQRRRGVNPNRLPISSSVARWSPGGSAPVAASKAGITPPP